MNTNSRSAFTLLEILIVITIIVILSALVLAAAHGVQVKGARSRAAGEIAALAAALESYKADNGDYPSNSGSYSGTNANSNLVSALMPTNGSKVYFEFKTNSLDGNNNFLDPFGNPYCYNYTNGSLNNGTNNYDLWSYAADSTYSQTNSWIKNW